VFVWNPARYAPAVQSLLARQSLPPLGPGQPDRTAESLLHSLHDASMFNSRPVVDPQMADCCRSALWLAFGYLEQSHAISQSVDTPEGSYWHGIMHRREPDFGNAKYWFRRVGRHAAFEDLIVAAGEVDLAAMTAAEGSSKSDDERIAAAIRRCVSAKAWDPMAFVELCQQVMERGGPAEMWCRQVAQIEWRMLFDYCYSRSSS
jgi:hypothetical protein